MTSRAIMVTSVGFALLAGQRCSNASVTILEGYDLLHTTSASLFIGGSFVEFEGVPLMTFDFGGSIGVQSVGGVDTIVHRTATGVGAYSGSVDIPIEFVALQLVSVAPVAALGGQVVFLTLDLSAPSVGSTHLTFGATEPESIPTVGLPYYTTAGNGHGTIDNTFTINFELRAADASGPLLGSGSKSFGTPSPAEWSHFPMAGHGPLIEGVNYLLNGSDQGNDLWLNSTVLLHDAGDGTHGVSNPEPEHYAVIGALGLVGFAVYRRRIRG